RFLPCGTN
ncbi:tRNA-dihydrouridine synthase C, partial [Haemophilus influenzae]